MVVVRMEAIHRAKFGLGGPGSAASRAARTHRVAEPLVLARDYERCLQSAHLARIRLGRIQGYLGSRTVTVRLRHPTAKVTAIAMCVVETRRGTAPPAEPLACDRQSWGRHSS